MFLFFAMQMFDQNLKICVYRFSSISCDSISSFVFAGVTISSNVFSFFLQTCHFFFLLTLFPALSLQIFISGNVFQVVFVFFPIVLLFKK